MALVCEVSIHAPVRGATFKIGSELVYFHGFNPRPRAGGDSLEVTPEGGIMMNKRDAAELLLYIEALERAAGMVRQ